jgi:hypothetical protein
MGQSNEQIFFLTKHTKVAQQEMNIINSMMLGINIFDTDVLQIMLPICKH